MEIRCVVHSVRFLTAEIGLLEQPALQFSHKMPSNTLPERLPYVPNPSDNELRDSARKPRVYMKHESSAAHTQNSCLVTWAFRNLVAEKKNTFARVHTIFQRLFSGSSPGEKRPNIGSFTSMNRLLFSFMMKLPKSFAIYYYAFKEP